MQTSGANFRGKTGYSCHGLHTRRSHTGKFGFPFALGSPTIEPPLLRLIEI